jgi:hypothetical protein
MTEMMTTVIGLLVAVIGLVTLVIRGQVKAQRPNGGKSQYDLLVLIDKRLDRLERNQDEHLGTIWKDRDARQAQPRGPPPHAAISSAPVSRGPAPSCRRA